MRYILREYFSFNKREKRGVLMLVFLNLLLLFWFSIKPFLFPREAVLANACFETNIPRNPFSLMYRGTPEKKFSFQHPVVHNRRRLPATELNSCDSAALESLRGIGPAFAKRILAYRDKLGGFYSIQQLMEVYGMDTARFELLCEQVILDPNKIRVHDLNSVTVDSLKSHPYIRFNLAKLIVSYREKHGPYAGVEDLQRLHLVNAELYSKIAPYFKVL